MPITQQHVTSAEKESNPLGQIHENVMEAFKHLEGQGGDSEATSKAIQAFFEIRFPDQAKEVLEGKAQYPLKKPIYRTWRGSDEFTEESNVIATSNAAENIRSALETASQGLLEVRTVRRDEHERTSLEIHYINPLDKLVRNAKAGFGAYEKDLADVAALYRMGLITQEQIYDKGLEVPTNTSQEAMSIMQRNSPRPHQTIRSANFIMTGNIKTDKYGDPRNSDAFNYENFTEEIIQAIQEKYPNPMTLMLTNLQSLHNHLEELGNTPAKIAEYEKSYGDMLKAIYGPRFNYFMQSVKNIDKFNTT